MPTKMPRRSWHELHDVAHVLARDQDVRLARYGSSIVVDVRRAGICAGLSTATRSPLVREHVYSTLGTVAIRSISYSRRSRSWTISRCSRPRKPQRKPKPSATEVSGSYSSEASLSAQLGQRLAQQLVVARRRSGRGPQNTIDLTRGSRAAAGSTGRRAVGDGVAHAHVGDVLDAGDDVADLAGVELVGCGVEARRNCPTSVTSNSLPVREEPDLVPRRARGRPPRARRSPRRGTGRTGSRRSARAAARRVRPRGGGHVRITASSSSATPMPVLALTRQTCSGEARAGRGSRLDDLVGPRRGQVDLVDAPARS